MGASRDFTNSSSDTVNVTSYSEITDLWTGGGTFTIWYRQTQNTRNVRFGTKFDGTKGWLVSHLGGQPSGLRFAHQRADGLQIWTSDTTPIEIGDWIHVAVVWDGIVTTNPTMYFNGVTDTSSVTSPNTGVLVLDDGLDFFMNNTGSGGSQAPDGLCAYVHMYDRELTQPEIKEIMHKPGSIRDGLVGYWPLTDEGSTQRNLSGIGNTGAVTGATSSNEGPPVTCFK